MRCWGWLRRIQPFGPVSLALLLSIAGDVLGVFAAILAPIIRILDAPMPAGLNIVIPVIRIDRSPGLLPPALAFPLALGG
jgi:hypothetical protein